MTKKEIKKLQNRLDKLYDELPDENTIIRGIISEIVELELLLEAESNQ